MQLTRPDFIKNHSFLKKNESQKAIEKRQKFFFVFISSLLILLPIFIYAVTKLSY
jgi:hypothetical protein